MTLLFGELCGLGGALSWALSSVLLTRLNRKVHLMTIGAVRGMCSTLFFFLLLPFYGGLNVFEGVDLSTIVLLVISMMLVLGIGDTLFLISAKQIGMVRTMPLSMTHVLFTFLLAAIFLNEQISFGVLSGALLILAGVYLLSSGPRAAPAHPLSKAHAWGIFLALATAVCWAAGTVILAPISQRLHPLAVNCIRQPAAALLFLLAMPKSEGFRQVRALTRNELATLVFAGTLATGLGSLLYLWSLRYAGASISAVLSATSPIFSTPLSILLLGEKATRRIVVGSVLIVAGVWLVIFG